MRVFLRYAVRETFSNLWRNRLMTLAAVLTVAVSLTLVGAALMFKQSASQASVVWEQQTKVTVWMNASAKPAEMSSIESQLKASPYIHGTCAFQTQQQSYHQALILLPESMSSVLRVQHMPSAFLCVPVVPTDASILISTFSGQPGVLTVTAPIKAIHQMQQAIRVVQYVAIALALTLLVSAIVLILNTIRLAIFARRREVSVMKLVGATNWFIRMPFISEGFMQGLFGSLVSVGLLVLLHIWYPFTGNEFHLSTQDLVGTSIVVVAVGVLIGSIGSAFAIRRFLDV